MSVQVRGDFCTNGESAKYFETFKFSFLLFDSDKFVLLPSLKGRWCLGAMESGCLLIGGNVCVTRAIGEALSLCNIGFN